MAKMTSFQKAQKYFLEDKLINSIKLFTDALAEGENIFNVHLSRGVAYLKTGDVQKALEDFKEAVVLDGGSERAMFYRGMAHLNLGNYEMAVEDLSKAIELKDDRGASYLGRGIALAELGRMSEAEADLRSTYVLNNVEIGSFLEEYAVSRTMLDRSIALLEGDRGPWTLVMTNDEIERMNQWR